MIEIILQVLQTINQLITAGIAISAFSLLLYALTFNLRDHVARSFAVILVCVAIVFVSDAVGSIASTDDELIFWLLFQWIGVIFLPSAYLHFSDALLATTGKPSRGRRRLSVQISYILAIIFLYSLWRSWLVGKPVIDRITTPYLQTTWLTWVFTFYYGICMVIALMNLVKASKRTVTSAGQRRMRYLLAGAAATAIGSFPYLAFGPQILQAHPLLFWGLVIITNVLLSVLLIVMAYSVAFFGVSWPDRVVKRRLFKWIMRGPVTASTVLAITTIVRRLGETWGQPYSKFVPIVMVFSLLMLEFLITLAAPFWERWLFHGGDRQRVSLLQKVEERLLTSGDLRQFLEAVLAGVCDRLQVSESFIAVLGLDDMEMMVTIGNPMPFRETLPDHIWERVTSWSNGSGFFTWEGYWLVPLFSEGETDHRLLGLLGILHPQDSSLDEEQQEALNLLATRATLALQDRYRQEQVFNSLESLTPEVDFIQRIRAASRYNSMGVFRANHGALESRSLEKWVKDALTHYWGGPKLTESPLMKLHVVQQIMDEYEGSPANALRAILRKGIEQVRPTGERRFTGEWILYNILEMKFMEGRKVREIAMRLALSEADLYRKQRVAIESVANAILDMENKAREETVRGVN